MPALSFLVCAECGRHGYFRDAEGNEGPEVCSKKEARQHIDAELLRGRVSIPLAFDLLMAVQRSRMTEKHARVDRTLRKSVERWNRMRAGSTAPPSCSLFHEFSE
jgi:hypothetical protein